jgi:aspartate carbamoyltransferase catalytic subunit
MIITGLTVTVVGDLKNNRMVHSLARLLSLYTGVKIYYVSPESLRMPSEVLHELNEKGIEQHELSSKSLLFLAISIFLYLST